MIIPEKNIQIEKIVELLKKLDDDGSFYGTIYNLYVLIGISKGVNDIRNGNTITLEDFNKEREALYESYNKRFG